MTKLHCFLILLFVALAAATDTDGIYRIGVGIGDITGPPAGIVLNGYVNPITHAAGIYTRQFARAFVVQSQTSNNTVTYVTTDMGMMDHTIRLEALTRLQAKYGVEMFNEQNVLVSATHTHSGVSGFMTYYAYLIIESYGFNPITYWAAVDGVVDAISAAADSLVDGRIWWNRGELLGGNSNRANGAYEMNPAEERARYEHNVDKDMTLLKMVAVEGDKPIGAFTWWPVHPISFNGGINPLVSSDNKGYAAILFDHEMEPDARPGKGKFVAGFGSSNLGDVSTTYDNLSPEPRWNFTPDIGNARSAGRRQFEKALELFNDAAGLQEVTGPILFRHRWVDSATVEVDYANETSGETEKMGLCLPALGYAYVGLDPEEWPFLDDIRDLIKEPSAEMIECQKPKLVALAAGEMDKPWDWAPASFSLQILQIGNFDVLALPGEYTTMAGRRVRNAVFNVTGHEVVLAGLANNYINYIATPEEYDVQEYEGGATVYGRNTVPVTATIFKEMAESMQNDAPYPAGEAPPSYLDNVRDELASWVDPPPMNGGSFGQLIVDVDDAKQYVAGVDEARAVFLGGSPRNSPLRKGTFLTVERKQEPAGTWAVVRSDADVDTLFYWNALARRIELQWLIPEDMTPGKYRMRHFGYYRTAEDGPLIPYIGVTSEFTVVSG